MHSSVVNWFKTNFQLNYTGKGKTGQETMLNQPDIHTENVTSLNSLKKKLQMDHRSKCKPKTVKFLEENTKEKLYDLGLGRDFLERTQKALNIKFF